MNPEYMSCVDFMSRRLIHFRVSRQGNISCQVSLLNLISMSVLETSGITGESSINPTIKELWYHFKIDGEPVTGIPGNSRTECMKNIFEYVGSTQTQGSLFTYVQVEAFSSFRKMSLLSSV